MDIIKYSRVEEINSKILEIKERILRKSKIEKRLEESKNTLLLKKKHLKNLKASLMKEESDVEKLEKLSWTSIVSSILGNKSEKLSKEKEEFYAMKIKHDDYERRVNQLEDEIGQLRGQLMRLKDVNREYRNLIEEKKDIIINDNTENTEMVLNKIDEISTFKFRVREIEEAIYAGEQAILVINDLLKVLNSAKDWGTWDMLGGGFLATSAKHSKLDEAKEISFEARTLLENFNRELKDVQVHMDFELRIDSFDRFADYFFDGLLADMNVQDKIKRSINDVDYARNKITSVLSNLRRELKENAVIVKRKEDEFNNMIEKL